MSGELLSIVQAEAHAERTIQEAEQMRERALQRVLEERERKLKALKSPQPQPPSVPEKKPDLQSIEKVANKDAAVQKILEEFRALT